MPESTLTINLFDGTRQLFSKPLTALITIVDGNQKQVYRDYRQGNSHTFQLPFFDNLGDNYAVLVYADGYRQVGFAPVKLSSAFATTLDLMLIEDAPGYSFVNARWVQASTAYPFLGGDTDAVAAQTRYEAMLDREPNSLACLLNLTAAMSTIELQAGTPLDYIQQVRWDKPPAQDRFFAWCDVKLIDQVRQAAHAGQFAAESGSAIFHPGATASWKQLQFGEANVQLTFHQNPEDCKTINGIDCVTVEPDIDYYKDLGAHAIFEVVPNKLTGSLTDPLEVYVLRWIAGRHAGVPEFAPKYTVV